MPQINLLLSGSKKKTPTLTTAKEPKVGLSSVIPVVAFRCAICLGIGLFVWIVLLINIGKKEEVLRGLEEKVKVLATNPIEIERIRTERAALEKKVKLIDDLSSRKFLWYEKLDLLSSLIPDGIWLTDIYSKQEKATAKDSGSSENNAASGLGEKTVFVIKGTAVAYKIQDAVTLIGSFINNLQNNKDFAKDFTEIKLNTATKGSIGGLDVMRFDFLCESK